MAPVVTQTSSCHRSFDGESLFVNLFQNHPQPEHDFVFLHGMGGDANAYQPLIEHLLKLLPKARCLAFDLRGHGFSSPRFISAEPALETYNAKDLAHLCRSFNLRDPVFVGHSYGGTAIQHYLNLRLEPHPRHTFLFCTPFQLPPYSLSRRFWFSLLRLTTRRHRPADTKRSLAHHQRFRFTADLNPARIAADARHTGNSRWVLMYLSMFGFRNTDIAQSLNHSNITLIYGHEDIFLPLKSQRLKLKTCPQAHIATVSSNHHQLLLTQTSTLARHISETFLSHSS